MRLCCLAHPPEAAALRFPKAGIETLKHGAVIDIVEHLRLTHELSCPGIPERSVRYGAPLFVQAGDQRPKVNINPALASKIFKLSLEDRNMIFMAR